MKMCVSQHCKLTWFCRMIVLNLGSQNTLAHIPSRFHQQPYIQKLSKDNLNCHSVNEMPDGKWVKGSTTTVLCKYIQHLTESMVDRVTGDEAMELIAA